MNKAFLIILVALSIISVNSEFHRCLDYNFVQNLGVEAEAADTDDLVDYCRVLSTSTDKTHCCYVKEKIGETEKRYCTEISDDAYENIKRYKKFMKNSRDKFKIKCGSEYLSYSLLVLLALLL